MEFMEMLEKHLSPVDFGRMQAWIANLPPEEQSSLMQFILDRETKAPAVGDEAPDFELPRLDGDGNVRLSAFRGRKPVALIFGSYT